MRVVWTKAALRGVGQAYDYIAAFNPRAAQFMAEALLQAGDSLVNHSHRGRLVRGTSMRELISVHPYIIRYEIRGEEVVILRVRHSARRPTTP